MRYLLQLLLFLLQEVRTELLEDNCSDQHFVHTGEALFSSCGNQITKWAFENGAIRELKTTFSIEPNCDGWIPEHSCLEGPESVKDFYEQKCDVTNTVKELLSDGSSLIVCDEFYGGTCHMYDIDEFPVQKKKKCPQNKDNKVPYFLAQDQRFLPTNKLRLDKVYAEVIKIAGVHHLAIAINVLQLPDMESYNPLTIRGLEKTTNTGLKDAIEIFTYKGTHEYSRFDNKIEFSKTSQMKPPRFHSMINLSEEEEEEEGKDSLIVGYQYESKDVQVFKFGHVCLSNLDKEELYKKFLEFEVECKGKSSITRAKNVFIQNNEYLLFLMGDGGLCYERRNVIEEELRKSVLEIDTQCTDDSFYIPSWIETNEEFICHRGKSEIKAICDKSYQNIIEKRFKVPLGITKKIKLKSIPLKNNFQTFQSWSYSEVVTGRNDVYNFLNVVSKTSSHYIYRKLLIGKSENSGQLSVAEVGVRDATSAEQIVTINDVTWTLDGTANVTAKSVYSCKDYSSCDQCLSKDSDPACGWCITTGMCSHYQACKDSDKRNRESPRFLGKTTSDYFKNNWPHQCPSLTIDQATLSYQRLINVKDLPSIKITVKNLPDKKAITKDELVCVFRQGSQQESSDLKDEPTENGWKIGDYTINCKKPTKEFLESMKSNPSTLVTLILRIKDGNDVADIAQNSFEVFNCKKLQTCNTCLNPKYNDNCRWCYSNNQCANAEGECSYINNIHNTKDRCPSVSPIREFIPLGSQTVTLKTSQFYQDKGFDLSKSASIIAKLQYLGKSRDEPVSYKDNKISFTHEFPDIPSDLESEYSVNLTILAKMSICEASSCTDIHVILDEPDGDQAEIELKIFKCPYVTGSCFTCVNAKDEYKCGFSKSEDKCVSKLQGSRKALIGHTETCPGPVITSVKPSHLWLESHDVLVEILGENFSPTGDQSEIWIDGYQCNSTQCTPENPDPRNKTCCFWKSSYSEKYKDVVMIKTSGSYQVTKNIEELGVRVGIPKVNKNTGVVLNNCGLQEFRIDGELLDAGREAEVKLCGKRCDIYIRTETQILCTTHSGAINEACDSNSILKIDGRVVSELEVNKIDVDKIDIDKIVPDSCILDSKDRSSTFNVEFKDSSHGEAISFATFDLGGKHGKCENINSTLTCKCPNVEVGSKGKIMVTITGKDYTKNVDCVLTSVDMKKNDQSTIISNPDELTIMRRSTATVEKADVDKPVKVKDDELRSRSISGKGFCLGWKECSQIGWKIFLRSNQTELPLSISSISDTTISYSLPTFANYTAHFGPEATQLVLKNGDWEQVAVNIVESAGLQKYFIYAGIGLSLIISIIVYIIVSKKKSHTEERLNADENAQLIKGLQAATKNEVSKWKEQQIGNLNSNRPESRMPPSYPFREYRQFMLHFMFPPEDEENVHYHKELVPYGTHNSRGGTIDRSHGLQEFKKLLGQREFLLVFVKTLESSPKFTSRDRSKFAAMLMISLQGKLEYATLILQYLIIDMIERIPSVSLGTLFRHSNTIGEKMLSYWFAMLMYRTVYKRTGEHVYTLFKKIKDLVHSEPVDQITGHSRMTLSEQYLLRVVNINENGIKITVLHHEGGDPDYLQILALYCDTIDQVKERILDAIYWDVEFSKRDTIADYDLEYVDNSSKVLQRRQMKNVDSTSISKDGFRKLNTVEHYHKVFLPNTKKFEFTDKRYFELKPSTTTTMLGQSHQSGSSLSRSRINISEQHSSNMPGTMGRSGTPLHGEVVRDGTGKHIVDYHHVHDGISSKKLAPSDHFALSMIRAKDHLENPIQVLIESIVSVYDRQYRMPMCIKYMFDFLDDEFQKVDQRNPDIIHNWKTNSLFLRYWVNLIKNPDFLFDINKSIAVSNSLTVVAQTLIDCCSTTESDPVLIQAQSTSKILFNKSVHNNFREWVHSYFKEVEDMEEIPRKDFVQCLQQENQLHQGDFNTNFAIRELFGYAKEFYNELLTGLNNDRECHQRKFGASLSRCISMMSQSAPVYAYAHNHPVPAPRRVFPN